MTEKDFVNNLFLFYDYTIILETTYHVRYQPAAISGVLQYCIPNRRCKLKYNAGKAADASQVCQAVIANTSHDVG